MANIDTSKKFLDLVWIAAPPTPTVIVLWTLPDRAAYPIPLINKNKIAETAQTLNATGANVYFSTCGVDPTRVIETRRGKREDVIAVPGLWADIDIAGHFHKQSALPPSMEVALAHLETFEYKPTLVVNSGNGLHLWWLYEEPLFFTRGTGEFERPQKLSLKFSEKLEEHFLLKKYEIDKVSDLARILRLPGTHNYKNLENPKLVELLSEGGPRYNYESLATDLVRGPGRPPLQRREPSTFTPTDAAWWPPNCNAVVAAVQRSTNAKAYPFLERVFTKRPLAEEGSRDNALNLVASVVAFSSQGLNVPAEDLVEILRPSVEAMGEVASTTDNRPPNMSNALDKMRRALESLHQKKDAELEQDQKIYSGLMKNGDNTARTDMYTVEDMKDFAALQKCTVADLSKRWIIQKGVAYYIFTNGKYTSPPRTKEELLHLPKFLAQAPGVDFNITVKDKTRAKSTKELIFDYGTVCSHVVSDLTISDSWYDAESETFYEAVCPLRKDLKPLYNEQIDKWLRLLGNEEADRLLDWIATITDLTLPSAALYIAGPPSVGKSMLTSGLAKLWGGAPTEISSILEAFNSDLARSPLVVADEQLPKGRYNDTTANLRQEVATVSRTLKRKYLPNTELRGAVRVILAANNDNLIDMTAEASDYDISAVSERILHISTGDAAGLYLQNLGGRKSTERWVEDDLIAKHALWLKDTRNVEYGSRFIVEGSPTEMVKKLATKGAGPLCEWLIDYLSCATRAIDQIRGIYVGGNKLAVHTAAIKQSWPAFSPNTPAPTANALGRSLTNISEGKSFRYGQYDYRFIKTAYLKSWASKTGYGNIAEMENKFSKEPSKEILEMLEIQKRKAK